MESMRRSMHRRRSSYDGQKVWSCNSNQRGIAPNITATHCVIYGEALAAKNIDDDLAEVFSVCV
jgi:hypothetical protein